MNNTKCGFVAILGQPNAGKSTLVNKMVGAKVSAVTPKEQTTRSRLRGICNVENSQIILIDTPGIFKPAGKMDNKLNRTIVENAYGSMEE